MNENEYGEVINGKHTYKEIAKLLKDGKTVGIGWSDCLSTHLDIIFKLGLDVKDGFFQRGLRENYLYVSIISFTSFGFCVENGIKLGGYIQEKLNMNDDCGDKLSELINGIIEVLNKKGTKNEIKQ